MNTNSLRKPFGDNFERDRAPRKGADRTCLADLIEVLQANPAGLRRWSVMRAMRRRCESAGREVSMKFEDNVERVFREHCSPDTAAADAEPMLFFRPKEKAGEVWAVHAGKAQAWLAGETP
jgi:hypothetical protein